MSTLRKDTINKSKYTQYDQGWDDYLKGVHQIDNPFAVNNWKHYEWEKGWLASKTHEKMAH